LFSLLIFANKLPIASNILLSILYCSVLYVD
jgi:hypothetical protein